MMTKRRTVVVLAAVAVAWLAATRALAQPATVPDAGEAVAVAPSDAEVPATAREVLGATETTSAAAAELPADAPGTSALPADAPAEGAATDAAVASGHGAAAAPATVAASSTPTPPAAAAPPAITFTAEPGRGFTLRAGDAFSVTLMARIQLRNTVAIADDDADLDADPEVTNELQVRTLRLWLRGHVLDPDIRYGIQLALGAGDFETLSLVTQTNAGTTTASVTNPSPIFDAYLDFTELRDLSVRIGQFFVPFDRARTIREFALQSVDRAEVIRELTLDRDVGVSLYSNDFLGWGGRLSYNLGVFGGDGRNRFGTRDPGFLYTARIAVRPFGSFDDDQEGDLTRSPEPRLMIGAAFAFNHQTDRPRSTTGSPYETYAPTLPLSLDGGPTSPASLSSVTFDQLHVAADLVFKWSGFYFLGEVVYRQATTPSHSVAVTRTDMGMPPTSTTTTSTLYARDAWGYLAQASMMLGPMFEVWGRWEHMVAIGPTDPTLISSVAARGHGVAGGVNCYLNGHAFKIQLDWAHSFGDDFGRGPHVVRLQLDASF